MTPTVLMDYGPQRQIKRSYDEISYRGVVAATAPRGYAETVGESGSPVRVDSEDSSAPKRKCISLNSYGFEVKRDTFVPAKLSSSERRYLRKRFRAELDSVRDLLRKPEFLAIVPVSRAPAFSSSAAPRPKKVQRGSHVIRGAKGRFLPTKPRPEASTVLTEATVLKQCEAILKKLMTQKFSHIFNVPVDVEKLNIPDYNDIIKHPMDLGTIKKKLDSGSYTSPSDFAADVRLTFNNAITYNPRGHAVHDMAIQLNKLFESRWKTVEKKLAAATAKPHVEVARADSKRRKTPPVDRSDLSMECVRPMEIVKPKMTSEEKDAFGNCLASLSEGPDEALPDHIIHLLQQCIPDNTDEHGDGEIEIDIHALSDDVLFELKKHVDKFLQERDHQHTNEPLENEAVGEHTKSEPSENEAVGEHTKSEPSENEAVGVSGLSHSSTDPCKGGEPVEEDVDICGNTSPILIEKDPQIRTNKLGSPSSSCSDSGSSSSDSDSGSDTESESEKVRSPANLAKGVMVPEQPSEQEKSDVISPVDPIHNAADVEPREHSNELNAAPEGESAKPDSQVSPDKLLRAALLRSRYADVIVKARGVLSQGEGGDTQEELEKLQKEEKARLLAEGNAAMEARRAEAEAESKRKRDLEREKARQALQEMERTVEINDNVHPKDLEMLGTATTEHIVSSVDETSPDHSQDGMPSFLPGSGSMLEKLGLFMKVDDEEEEEEEEPSVPSSKDGDEGEEEPSVLCSKDKEEGEKEASVLCSKDGEEGEEEPSVLCSKDQREEGEEQPIVLCSEDMEEGEKEASVLCSKDGEEGEEPSVLCSKDGEEGEEEPSVLCSEDMEEGEKEASVLCSKDGEEGEEPSVLCSKDGEEGEEEPSVLCSKDHREEGEEQPSVLCSKDGEEGDEEPSVPSSKDGEEGEEEPSVPSSKDGEEGEIN